MKYTPAKPSTKAPPTDYAKARAVAAHARAHAKPPGEIRIIGGQYKRTKLPVANKPGLRPTPDRVRETLFNWLGQDLTGWRCVDVFAGTGALGFEAASRGASEVLLCEQDPALVLQLKALQTRLQAAMVRIERGDGLSLLRRLPAGSQQLVLLDPPFESTLFEPALKAAAQVLGPTGLIYLEAPKAWSDEELAPLGLQVHRSGKAGAVHFHLLAGKDAPAA
ncbi:16S rRNA (guanine(966)-N(2))-methyltransferase RsmD [Polaromonas jejuensis]|uniref:16S rRNA (Guanine(966)-N(2))-methyltransferase RsmD n=1 Tax=Polaromonas jejuensis TaxID=457502 RepID=A0ABW0Q7P7_9BURK|nr:16S rRNA (guanine(966)-N(2))-methyltransferase RsmD [Polaromonas jejuensis]